MQDAKYNEMDALDFNWTEVMHLFAALTLDCSSKHVECDKLGKSGVGIKRDLGRRHIRG
jgi:hypothetical protein